MRGTSTDGFARAVADARAADVAICFVGGRSGLMPDCTSGEFRDVSDLGLPGVQQQLVEAVVATGTPTVVVVVSGRAHALPWIAEHVPALVYAWVPGEQGGAAIADVLFGVESPSGRLPISLPRSAGHVPVHHDHRAGGGRSQIFGDYVDAPGVAVVLLRRRSHVHDVRVRRGCECTSPRRPARRSSSRSSCATAATRAGTEVVQLFLRDEVARVARPDRQLAGFARVDARARRSRRPCASPSTRRSSRTTTSRCAS